MSQSIVPVAAIRNLPAVQAEIAVTAYLVQARDRLADALTATGPQAVAAIKAEVSTVAEATKQLGLSKEIQEDAKEMIRRAEYALGKAIRKGQEEGAVATRATATKELRARQRGDITPSLPSATDIEADFYANASKGSAISQLSDDATDDEFEEALTEARAEGNLSRANVVRKIKGQKSGQRTRQQLADEIADLADDGHTSQQIAKKLGVGEQWVRETAREYGVTIQADAVRGKRQRIDSQRILSNVAESVAASAFSIRQIDTADLDEAEALEWVDSLTESLNALRREVKKIKESFHDQG